MLCYHYRILEVAARYTLLALTVGTDTCVVCLNDAYPTPVIRQAVPDTTLELIWYSKEQVAGDEELGAAMDCDKK